MAVLAVAEKVIGAVVGYRHVCYYNGKNWFRECKCEEEVWGTLTNMGRLTVHGDGNGWGKLLCVAELPRHDYTYSALGLWSAERLTPRTCNPLPMELKGLCS